MKERKRDSKSDKKMSEEQLQEVVEEGDSDSSVIELEPSEEVKSLYSGKSTQTFNFASPERELIELSPVKINPMTPELRMIFKKI